MALQGQTVIAASGDTGSEDCLPTDGSTALAVDDPGSQPDVVSAGGTSMASASASSQSVWNDCQGTSPACCQQHDPRRGRRRLLHRVARQPGPARGDRARHHPVPASAPAGPCRTSRIRRTPRRRGGRLLERPLDGLRRHQRGGAHQRGALRRHQPGLLQSARPRRPRALCSATGQRRDLHRHHPGNNDFTDTNVGQFAAGTGFDAASGLGTPVDPTLALALQGAHGCPSVAAVSPNTGPVSGAGAITIFGGGFANATSVSFGAAGRRPDRGAVGHLHHGRPAERTLGPVRRRHRGQPAGDLGAVGRRPLRVRRQPQLRPGLPLRRLRRGSLQLRRRRLLRQRGRLTAERAGGGHGRHAELQRLLAGGHRRRDLQLRRRPASSVRWAASTSTGRSWALAATPDGRRLLVGGLRRRHLLLRRRAVLRLHRRHPAQQADRGHGRRRPTATATGSSPPTAGSSPTATRSSTARRAPST